MRRAPTALAFAALAWSQAGPRIEVWHGASQRVGHLGVAQDDFNLMGHVAQPGLLDSLSYSLDGRFPIPLSFRAYRRLVSDGDFNADIPIGRLRPGVNEIRIDALYRDGTTASQQVRLALATGTRALPVDIRWADVRDPQDVGQYVDGKWSLTPDGLRTAQTGYDRIFLIGESAWRDYDATATVRIHHVESPTPESSGGNGLGLICRFTGHVTGGPLHFPSGQPKFGYQPFGAIGWLRWIKNGEPPVKQFMRGDSNRQLNHGSFPVGFDTPYRIRMRVETLPGDGVSRYSFRIWPAAEAEPAAWDWRETQTSGVALRRGGVALLAHHVDATFGDIGVTAVPQGEAQ